MKRGRKVSGPLVLYSVLRLVSQKGTGTEVKTLKTKDIVVSALLAAIAIVLGATGLGFVPVPTPAGRATIMHIPAILAGVLEGPLVGAFVGGIFGLYSFFTTAVPFLRDPLIAIVPRILIGVCAAFAFKATRSSGIAAIVGTLTNTGGVLGLAVLRGYLPPKVALGIAVTHGLPEVVVAFLLVVLITRGLVKHFPQLRFHTPDHPVDGNNPKENQSPQGTGKV